MSHVISTGTMLAESGNAANDRVFLQATLTPPWWAFWRRRVTTLVMTAGQARTVAVGLKNAASKLDIKRRWPR